MTGLTIRNLKCNREDKNPDNSLPGHINVWPDIVLC